MARHSNSEMLLTAPTKWVKGRYSGVDLSNGQDNVVVCVHDVERDKYLYYHVGAIDHVSEKIVRGDTRLYDTGQYPSVALLKMGGSLYVVEVHQADLFNNCYYKIGKVKTSDKSILWQHSEFLGRGRNPKLAANDNGIVVAVKELSWSYYNYYLQLVVLSVAKAGSGLVVQQHLVVGYKACTSYMQLLLPYHHNTSTANY